MDNRRSDIGIMRSMGASRSRVVRQYITEAVILLTVAFIVALPLILHIVLVDGFAEPAVCTLNKNAFPPNPEYGVNNTYIHFAWVTAITFIAMLAITVIGTFIPVYRATRILPADALRDE
jgi:ABC-type antimicrobial peptide transport system permease subunit